MKILLVIVGFVCNYIVIKLYPFTETIRIPELLISFIFNPLLFFIAMLLLMIGFMSHSIIVGHIVKITYFFLKGKHYSFSDYVIILIFGIGYYLLLQTGFWHTVCFLFISSIYGMIAVDLKGSLEFDKAR